MNYKLQGSNQVKKWLIPPNFALVVRSMKTILHINLVLPILYNCYPVNLEV